MRVMNGLNPDYGDFDEFDADVIDAMEEFEHGTLTFEELRAVVGTDAARRAQRECYGAVADDLLDDPESF